MHSMTTGQSIRVVDVHGSTTALPMTLINSYSSLSVPAYKRAICFLADNLASFPRSVRRDGSKQGVDHPLNRLLKRRPNRYQTAVQFWRTLYFHTAHTGNGYARIQREGPTFRPAALHLLLPEDVLPFRYDEGNGPEQFYFHRPSKTVIAGDDVLHIHAGLSYDGMAGMDPVSLHEQTFQRATTLERFQVQFLRKGTIIRGAVEIPGGMTPEQRAEIKAVLRTYRGAEADDDVLVLSDGAKLTNATTSPEQSQLVQQGAAVTKQIAQLTGVPPEFLFELSEAKYNASVEQQGQNVVRYTFRPWIVLVEAEMTAKLLSEAEQDSGFTIGINPDALLRGDTKTQVDSVLATVKGGIRTRNEGRALLDLPPDADPDSNKLHALGETNVPSPADPPRQNAQSRPQVDLLDALGPVIADACRRVDTKTDKAFDNASRKTGQDRTVWVNVFAEEQAKYAADAMKPVSEAIVALGGDPLDFEAIGQRYASTVRRRAATGEICSLTNVANFAKGIEKV